MKHLLCLAVFITIVFSYSSAQKLPVPGNIQSAFANGTRTESGMPGTHYWQNSATYQLDIHFDPQTRILRGVESIDYVNNSPDTLHQIVFKLYPNLYQKGAVRLMPVEKEDITDGVIIDSLHADINTADTLHSGTNWVISKVNVMPSAHVHFNIEYHYTLNQKSHIRTGEIEPGADFIAYFFPRIAVYDDIDGWNNYPYLGPQEFYNDFCDFDVHVSVPKNFVVWCTGNLVNGKELLNDTYFKRLQQAELSDSIITIIDSTDLTKKNITVGGDTLSWHYTAQNVTDVAFALSDHYLWQSCSVMADSTTGRRTRVDAAFNPKHKDFLDVADFARQTVYDMSYRFPAWPYPYPHETVFDGLDQMEYPMMVNDNPLEKKEDVIELTDHEIFHTMFPFYMGINETKYAWMDEGWATIGEWLISPMIDSSIEDNYGVAPYEATAGKELDLPIITLSTQENGTPYFLNSYPKPAFGYLYVKDMLGDERFTAALHHYIDAWRGKHPIPNDFFNCINEGAGENMNWFWKAWFMEDGVPDLAIQNVKQQSGKYIITVENRGGKPIPVDLTFYLDDNTTQKLHSSVSCWKNGNKTTVLSVSTNKKVKKITLGSLYTPDRHKEDNVYLPK